MTIEIDLTGKTIIITGAAGGIGSGTVEIFTRAGANLILTDIAPAVVEQLFIASQQCDLLLKQCPGVLSSAVCHRQLSAIMLPLTSAISQIDTPVKRRWPWQRH